MTDKEKLIEAAHELNFYRNCHYNDSSATEEYKLAQAINDVLPTLAQIIASGVTVGDKMSPTEPLTNCQQTNADRIRAMSDEELANWLARTQYSNMMEAADIFGAILPFSEETLRGTEQECLEWLQQPAEGD